MNRSDRDHRFGFARFYAVEGPVSEVEFAVFASFFCPLSFPLSTLASRGFGYKLYSSFLFILLSIVFFQPLVCPLILGIYDCFSENLALLLLFHHGWDHTDVSQTIHRVSVRSSQLHITMPINFLFFSGHSVVQSPGITLPPGGETGTFSSHTSACLRM